jgi:Na+/H+-translocating membrane pyrophosphatase
VNYINNFLSSLSVAQLAAALGALTFLLHTLLNYIDKNNAISREFNKFIRNAMIVLVPLFTTVTQVANDPNFASVVHTYAPSLAFFVTTYQGLYWAFEAILAKFNAVKALLDSVATEPQQF